MILLDLAATALAFNLNCTGLESTGTRDQMRPFEIVLRIDVESLRWCSGPCEATRPIFATTPKVITLEKGFTEQGNATQTAVNLENGKYLHGVARGDDLFLDVARCERSEFTGFPR